MTKSQLTVRLSSKKTNRHVSPVAGSLQLWRLRSLSSVDRTFAHCPTWVNTLVECAKKDGASPGGWTSTHLVTISLTVEDSKDRIEHVVCFELNGSQLCLLHRYINRFMSEAASRSERHEVDSDLVWVPYDFRAVYE